ncbi:tape measure protein [Sphingopyxis sp. GW247-27LB]|uniref:tape measure protein n=1 Tax=Sphingopyxis sp. GW247-27LB TaxID=2012632 RepID=UPI000BA7617B|nr:tape measure protein [Sphingopyxis sp. GW247-27LB]PAL25472.1 hypothetical protein CD928_03090 [Sphingopyxis sp. GW247-27LB]
MALKFAMILQAVDRLSGPAKRANAGARTLVKGALEIARRAPGAARAMDMMSRAAERIPSRLRNATVRVRQLAGHYGMKALEKSAYGAGVAIGWTIRKVGTLILRTGQLAAATAALGAGAAIGGIISVTSKFEQFQIMLEGIEGSSEKAKASMAWVRNFAKTTPYELDQVMEAFVQLKAYGIDPIGGALAAAGDAAAGMSKPLMQAIEALADAQTGEFERLKEFGIRARVEGNRVAFTYMKNGREIRREVAANATAMRDAITGIWSDRFGGMMERQSKTFSGMISNLKDGWTDFLLRVGQAGIFDKVKARVQSVLDWLNKRLDDGSIDKWAQNVSDRLEKIVDWASQLTEKDWATFGSDLWNIAKAAWSIAKALASAVDWALRLVNTQEKIKNNGATTVVDGGPLFRIRRANDAPPPPRPPKAPPMSIRSSPRATPINLRGTTVNPRASTAAPQKVAVGGSMTVEIKPPPGWSAKPTRMSSANDAVPLVYRGGSMVRGG